jgi:hypothetical protein
VLYDKIAKVENQMENLEGFVQVALLYITNKNIYYKNEVTQNRNI